MSNLLRLRKFMKKESEKPKSNYVPPVQAKFGWRTLFARQEKVPHVYSYRHLYNGVVISHNDGKFKASRDNLVSYLISLSYPEQEESHYLAELFSEYLSNKAIDISSIPDIRALLRLGLTKANTMFNDQVDMIEEDYQDLIRIYPQNRLPNIGQAAFIRAMLNDKEHEYDLDEIIMYASALFMTTFKADLELNLLAILVTFVKSGNCSDEYIQRKKLSHRKFSPMEPSFGVTLSMTLITKMWSFLEYYFKKQMISPDDLRNNLGTLLESLEIENVAIAPLIRQVVYRNLTGIKSICDSLSEFPDFPWGALSKKHAKIGAEIKMFTKYLQLIQNDKLIGYKISGMATEYPNLAYLCIQMQITINGKRSLLNYKGIGGTETQVANRQYLQSLISEYQKDMIAGIGSYSALKEIDEDLHQSLRNALTGFLTNDVDEDEDEKDDNEGHGSGNPPPPNNPGGSGIPRQIKRGRSPQREDLTPKKSKQGDDVMYEPNSPYSVDESKIEEILRAYDGEMEKEDVDLLNDYFKSHSISEEMRFYVCPSTIRVSMSSKTVEIPLKDVKKEMHVTAFKFDGLECPVLEPTFLTIIMRLRDTIRGSKLNEAEEGFAKLLMNKTTWTRLIAEKTSDFIVVGRQLEFPLGLAYSLPSEETYYADDSEMAE